MAGLGTTDESDIRRFGEYVETTSSDGQVTRMNIGDVPPTRTIGLEGSDLRIDTDVPIGELYPAIAEQGLAYEAKARENTPKIGALEALNGSAVQEFLQSEDYAKESFENVIRII